jgi:pimeloyl-ACP methyl ester carboxylesterase
VDRDFDKKFVILPGGLKITYVDQGLASGTAIVWIHGMGSYRESFHPVLKDPPVSARHVALDLPGFGDSGHLGRRQTLADYAASVHDFLEVLQLDGVVLAGHSFGGMVAGETAIRHPERLLGIILISSAGWVDPINALKPTAWVWINRLGIWITGFEYFGRQMLRAIGVNPDTIGPEDRRRLQRGWRRAYEMARMGEFYRSPQFADRLFGSGVPSAVIHGSRDPLFPFDQVRTVIADRAPLWVIEESGHVPFLSHPNPFAEAFREAYAWLGAFPRSGTP